VNSLASHPIAEALRNAARGADAPSDPNTAPAEGETRGADESDSFSPAIDTFSTPTEYVLHIALPGARKEDVGVNWDAEKGELNIAGVVYRAGDEEFIASLKTGERRVGVFERSVKLPLESDEKVEVDGEEISAKLEDGVLVVRVGKVVKEEAWTDLKRVEVL
jgi:HSP20 family protein